MKDLSGQEITSFVVYIEKNATSQGSVSILCRSGKFLQCDPVAGAEIYAKHHSDVTWIDIETTPIDLTPWANTYQTFDLRFVAGNVSVDTSSDFSIFVK